MDSNYDYYPYTLGGRFHDIANRHRHKKALIYPDDTYVTYGELFNLAARWSGWLQKNNICRHDVIAIFNNKSPAAFALMIASAANGIIYTNLDDSSPEIRISKMLAKAEPEAIFFDEGAETHNLDYSDSRCHHINTELKNELKSCKSDLMHADVLTNDPAYIMFTSGSTGFPKGAVMSQQNVLNLIHWAPGQFGFKKDEIFTNVNPIYFDNSVFDFYTALFNGYALAPFSNSEIRNPFELIEKVSHTKCTSWFSVPSLLVYLLTMKALQKNKLPDIRRFIFGGEGFPKRKLKQLYEMRTPGTDLWNVYGPTECTCICSAHKVNEDDFRDMEQLTTLGYLISNFDYELYNREDNEGELALKGPQVGLGYINDAKQTNSRFIPTDTPWCENMYLTGDWVMEDTQERLHFRGRTDNQIKHMGYRIELEEIEASFQSVKGIHEAAVIYKEGREGSGKIVAFIAKNDTLQLDKLKDEIRKKLPQYMIPKEIRELPSLPKNRNGKVDRNQLKQKV